MNNKKILKGIFFDFDGVITLEKKGTPTIVGYISEKTGIPYESVDASYRKYNRELLRGTITHKDMWKSFCMAVGQDISYEILEQSFLNISLDPKMTGLIRDLKRDYKIGMITDNKADRIESIIEKTELKGLFDFVIISANVNAQKTEEKIFIQALNVSGLKATECVFIDNTAANLVVPEKMGFKTILFDDELRDYSAIEETIYFK